MATRIEDFFLPGHLRPALCGEEIHLTQIHRNHHGWLKLGKRPCQDSDQMTILGTGKTAKPQSKPLIPSALVRHAILKAVKN